MDQDKIRSLQIPSLHITYEAQKKLDLYIQHCDVEISGLGEIDLVNNNELWIKDIYIFPQSGSMVGTLLDSNALIDFLTQRTLEGKDGDILRCWWHSHVNMRVFYSATDLTTIERFTGDYLISLVGNKKHELLARLDIYNPLRLTLDLSIQTQSELDLEKTIKAEIKSKTRIPILAKPTLKEIKVNVQTDNEVLPEKELVMSGKTLETIDKGVRGKSIIVQNTKDEEKEQHNLVTRRNIYKEPEVKVSWWRRWLEGEK